MNYILNEAGEVKVRSKNGQSKYIQKHLAEDKQLMKTMHFEIVEAPLNLKDVLKEDPNPEPDKEVDEQPEQANLAEAIPAKRGRKPNK